MKLSRWDPWEAIKQLRAETDQLMDSFLEKLSADQSRGESVAFLPEVDLVESQSEYRVYLSVPGSIEEDIDLTVDETTLTIRGERHPPYDAEGTDRRTNEWRYGFFERCITFPEPVDAEAVRATVDAGVLTIVLPKISQ